MRTLGTAMRAVREQVIRDEAKLFDAIEHLSTDRVAAMITIEPWLETAEPIRDELLGELIAAGQRVKLPTMTKQTLTYRFDATRPEAARWAEKEAGLLITQVVQEQVTVVRNLVLNASMGQMSPRQTARALRTVIGLTSQQAGWVQNFQEREIDRLRDERGLTYDQAFEASERATQRYHDRIHRYRTETIARTEILRASNEGRVQSWQQGVDEGFIVPSDYLQEWSTEIDGRECEICSPLNGTQVAFDDVFPEGDPPIHPNCRCDVLLVPRPLEDIAQMTDEQIADVVADDTEDVTQPTEDDPFDSYRGAHGAPGREEGAPMHDLTGGGDWYPEDVYGADGARFYGTGAGSELRPMEEDVIRLFREVRGDPDATVTIYRSLPSSVEDATINPGDWVSPSKDYAEYHGERILQGDYQVIAIDVKADELYTEANSLLEWGYDPREVD